MIPEDVKGARFEASSKSSFTVGNKGVKSNLVFLRTVVGTCEVIGKQGVLDI